MNKFVKVLFALGLTVLMATPALAEFSVYSSIRMSTFYLSAKAPDGGTLGADKKDTSESLHWGMQNNSRLGAKFANGDLSGQVELAVEGSTSSNAVGCRLIYGVYKFDGGNLLVGQAYTPYMFLSQQVFGDDMDNIGFGGIYDSRQPQIKVSLDNGFYLALIQPKSGAIKTGTTGVFTYDSLGNPSPVYDSTGTATTTDVTGTTRTFMPKVAVGYDGKFDNVTAGGGFAYNAFSEKNATNGFSKTISSYLAYLRGSVDLNPFDLSATVHYGQNLGNFGILGRNYSTAIYDTATNKLEDAQSYGGWVQVGYKMAKNVKWYAGAGYSHDHNKAMSELSDIAAGVKDVSKATYFLQAQVTVAPGFQIVPEFDYFQFIKGYNDGFANSDVLKYAGATFNPKNAWALGAKWQMDF